MTVTERAPRSLLALARECREAAEAMTGSQLDDWHEEQVGYRISADDPTAQPSWATSMVAEAMFLDGLPRGSDTPGAKHMRGLLHLAIVRGVPL